MISEGSSISFATGSISVTTGSTSATESYMEHFNHYHGNHRSHILLQGGFFSRLRKVFRKKPKQSSKRDKRGKKERNKNVINDPVPTKIVNEVTDEDNVVLHLATELGRETLAQEMNERHETVTRL